MKSYLGEGKEPGDISETEKEETVKELIDGYKSIFSYYLLSRGESFAKTDHPKEDFVNLVKKTIELVSMEDEKEKELIQALLDGITQPENLSYYDLAVSLDLLGSTIETSLYKLRMLTYREMEKNNPDIAKKYIKTIF